MISLYIEDIHEAWENNKNEYWHDAIDKITDADMTYIARHLADTMMDGGGFWEGLRYHTESIIREIIDANQNT